MNKDDYDNTVQYFLLFCFSINKMDVMQGAGMLAEKAHKEDN